MELTKEKEIERIKKKLIQLEKDFVQRLKDGEYSPLDYVPFDRLSFYGSQKEHTLKIMNDLYIETTKYLEKLQNISDLEYVKMLLNEKDKEIQELKDNLDGHHIDY